MTTMMLPEGTSLCAIRELQEFIAQRPHVREVRKALAVKLVYQGYLYEEIQTILDVSLGSITGWKQAYEQNGIDGLRLNHKGRKSYLMIFPLLKCTGFFQKLNRSPIVMKSSGKLTMRSSNTLFPATVS